MSTPGRKKFGVFLIVVALLAMAFFSSRGVSFGNVGNAPYLFNPTWPMVVVIGLFASGVSFVLGPKREKTPGNPRTTASQTLIRSLWAVVGAIFGGVLGVIATFLTVKIALILSPNDPSAGSVGIIIIAFLPVGMGVGAFVGFRRSVSKVVRGHKVGHQKH